MKNKKPYLVGMDNILRDMEESQLLINLIHFLTLKGDKSILLVDMNWELNSDCFNIKMETNTNTTISDWVIDISKRKKENIETYYTKEEMEKYIVNYKKGLDVLVPPRNRYEHLLFPENVDKIIIENLKENNNYDIIIILCCNKENCCKNNSNFKIEFDDLNSKEEIDIMAKQIIESCSCS